MNQRSTLSCPAQSSAAPADQNLPLSRQPLIQFLAIGAVIFALDAAVSPAIDSSRQIVVDDELKTALTEKFFNATQRQPAQEELQQMIEGWIQQEVLYREGLALGLDRSDGMIRERIISSVRSLTLSNADVQRPTANDLVEYYTQHTDKYRRQRRYDIEHYVIAVTDPQAAASAEALLTSLQSGTPDRKHRLLQMRDRSAQQLAALFGQNFPGRLDSLPTGQWQLVRSARGLHVLRVIAVKPAGTPAFETIRERVVDDWRQQHRLAAAAGSYAQMRAKYRVVTKI